MSKEISQEEQVVDKMEDVPEASNGQIKSEIKQIELNRLVPNKEQYIKEIRNQEVYDRTKADIQRHGINQLILIRPIDEDKYEVVSGHNRYRIAKELGWTHIEAKVVEMSDDESAERALIDNQCHQQLSPFMLERCIAIRFKNGYYETHHELAEILGFSDRWIEKNIKAYKIREQMVKDYNNNFETISTEGIIETYKLFDAGDLQDVVKFLERAVEEKFGTTKIKALVNNILTLSEEGRNNYLYNKVPLEKVQDAEERNQESEPEEKTKDTKEQNLPKEDTIATLYNVVDKKLKNYFETSNKEQRDKAIPHIKLMVRRLFYVLLKEKRIDHVHYRMVINEMLNIDEVTLLPGVEKD